MQRSVSPPVAYKFYERPYLLNAEGEELGETAEGFIPPPEIDTLRADLFKVKSTSELAAWLNQAGYITTNRTGWLAKDITPALYTRFFLLRDILSAWLTGATRESLEKNFPSELVEEVCWTESSASAVFVHATVDPSGVTLPVYSPRIALILSVHMDRFWRGRRLFGRCPKCYVVFEASRPDKLFCSQRCKRAAGALAYYHRKKKLAETERVSTGKLVR
jgi:hypothetical protein